MIVRRDDGVEQRVAFESDLRIGRDEENDLVLEDRERSISRFHAEIRRGSPHWSIVDLGSRNGTLVDGTAIKGATPLPPGAIVTMGPFSLEILPPGANTSTSLRPLPPPRSETIYAPVNAKPDVPSSPNRNISSAPAARPTDRSSSLTPNEKRAWLLIATALVVLFVIVVFL